MKLSIFGVQHKEKMKNLYSAKNNVYIPKSGHFSITIKKEYLGKMHLYAFFGVKSIQDF